MIEEEFRPPRYIRLGRVGTSLRSSTVSTDTEVFRQVKNTGSNSLTNGRDSKG